MGMDMVYRLVSCMGWVLSIDMIYSILTGFQGSSMDMDMGCSHWPFPASRRHRNHGYNVHSHHPLYCVDSSTKEKESHVTS